MDRFRNYCCSRLGLYYEPKIIRLFLSSFASTRLIILQGISGTGKTSLPYAFGKFLNNPAVIASVQPSWRDRSELFGYFNEFTKKYTETELLTKMYEAKYNDNIYVAISSSITFGDGILQYGYDGYFNYFGGTVASSNTGYKVLGNNCGVTSLKFPSGSVIAANAFSYCTYPNLKTITLTGAASIGYFAFGRCYLGSDDDPADINARNVGIIGGGAFGAYKLGTVTVGVDADSEEYSWGGTVDSDTTSGIFAAPSWHSVSVEKLVVEGYVPANSVTQSALAGGWNNYITFGSVDLTKCKYLSPYALSTRPSGDYAASSSDPRTTIKCTTLYLPNSLTSLQTVYYSIYFPNLTSFTFDENPEIGSYALASCNMPSLESISFVDGIKIGTGAFRRCTMAKLKTIALKTGCVIGDSAFAYTTMASLTSIDFSGAASIGNSTFQRATLGSDDALVDINARNVGIIGGGAFGAYKLGTVTVGVDADSEEYSWGGTVDSDTTSGIFAAPSWHSVSVEKLVVEGYVPANSVTQSALAGGWNNYITFGSVDLTKCKYLSPYALSTRPSGDYAASSSDPRTTIKCTTLYLPNSLTSLQTVYYSIYFPNLTSFTFDENPVISNYMFASCGMPAMETISFEGVQIGTCAFRRCNFSKLTTISIGDGCVIGNEAFRYGTMSVLTSVNLTGTKSVGAGAFAQCSFGSTAVSLNAKNVGIIGGGAFGAYTWGTVTVGVDEDSDDYCFGGDFDGSCGLFAYASWNSVVVDKLIVNGYIPAKSTTRALAGNIYSYVTFNTVDLSDCNNLTAYAFSNGDRVVTIKNEILSLKEGITVGNYAFRNVNFTNLKLLKIGDNTALGSYVFYQTKMPYLWNIIIGDKCSLGKGFFASSTISRLSNVSLGSGCTAGESMFDSSTLENTPLLLTERHSALML